MESQVRAKKQRGKEEEICSASVCPVLAASKLSSMCRTGSSSPVRRSHPAETSAELNVRLGAAEFFPGASRQVRRVRKRRREGNARAAQGTASGRESGTRYKPAIRR